MSAPPYAPRAEARLFDGISRVDVGIAPYGRLGEGGVIVKVVRLGKSTGLDGLHVVEEEKPGTPARARIVK